jgi:hypothetical protein
MKIVTNHQQRLLLDAHNLTSKERAEHDYLDWDAIERGEDSATFIRYLGHAYLLSDFSGDYGITRGAGLPDVFAGWDGYLSESFFSGVVIRFVPDDNDRVIVGRYYS